MSLYQNILYSAFYWIKSHLFKLFIKKTDSQYVFLNHDCDQ